MASVEWIAFGQQEGWDDTSDWCSVEVPAGADLQDGRAFTEFVLQNTVPQPLQTPSAEQVKELTNGIEHNQS